MTLSLACWLVSAHFVADFVAQSNWMALNKSKRWGALSAHVGVYTVILGSCALLASSISQSPARFAWFVIVNACAHFIQDALTSRLTSALWFIDLVPTNWIGHDVLEATVHLPKRHWFFVAIGFDQLLHYITLFVTASWWLA